MFSLQTEDRVVIASFDLYLINKIFQFRFDAGTDWAARLLLYALREAIEKKMSSIRKEAYDKGWKDAKARKPKESWFSSELL